MRAEVWVGPERRGWWSIDEKRRIVREAFAPDVRVADVARGRDVSRAQVSHWRSELADEQLASGTEIVGFVPVNFTMDGTATSIAREIEQLSRALEDLEVAMATAEATASPVDAAAGDTGGRALPRRASRGSA
jgi:transposase-like protein